MDHGVVGPVVLARFWPIAADRERRGESQGLKDWVVNVAPHIAKRAGAKINPLPPVARVIVAIADERPLCGDPQPQIPVEGRRNRIGPFRPWRSLAPFLVAPGVHLFYLAN